MVRWVAINAGIIPAYAGNTPAPGIGTLVSWGSSPHTRGTLNVKQGKAWINGDHPRIRGEHVNDLLASVDKKGIIPAYAGNTNCMFYQIRRLWGIIPAYAGNTSCLVLRKGKLAGSSPHTRGTQTSGGRGTCRARDHPRIRGEHAVHQRLIDSVFRIIPAYAGNTLFQSWCLDGKKGSSPHTRGTPKSRNQRFGCRWDHPRIRGEHATDARRAKFIQGIIPAYAGNTRNYFSLKPISAGSSPHTRGTHLFTCDPNSRRGSFVSLYPKRRALCLLLASLQPDFLAP